MAENSFLAGMKIDQFIKSNNDQIKTSFSDSFNGVAKSISESIKVQKTSINALDKINSKLDSNITTLNTTVSKIYEMQKSHMKLLSGNKTKDLSKTLNTVMSKQYSMFLKTAQSKDKSLSQPKDYFKREDSMQDTEDLLSSIDKGISRLTKADEKKFSGSGGLLGKLGIMGSLGGLLSSGGLLSFLLTGKQEALFSVVKGFRYMAKGAISGIMKVGDVIGGMAKMTKNIPSVLDKFKKVSEIYKNSSGSLGFVMDLGTKVIPKIGEGLTKFSTKIEDVSGKVKGVVETTTKTLSGLKNFVSAGLKGGVKGIGGVIKTGVGAAIKGVGVGIKTAAGAVFKGGAKGIVKRVPILGSILGISFAISRISKGDIVGGGLELASAAANVIPEIGSAISLGIDGYLLLRDLKKNKNKKSGGASASSGGMSPIGDAYPISSSSRNKPYPITYDFLQNIGTNDGLDASTSFMDKTAKFAKSGVLKLSDAYNYLVHSNDNKNSGFYLNKKSINVAGVNPQMWGNFVNMAAEYKARTGKSIGINSAYRSLEEQQRLWDKSGHDSKKVAPPGKSMHNYGYAMDINSFDGNKLDSMGLISKWGFDRPVSGEPWHIEPQGLKSRYSDIRSSGGDGKVGDAYPMKVNTSELPQAKPQNDKNNVPMGNVANKPTSDKPMLVVLSDKDIQKLAVAFGKQIAFNKSPNNKQINAIGGNGRVI